jgi:hypothetical protein
LERMDNLRDLAFNEEYYRFGLDEASE